MNRLDVKFNYLRRAGKKALILYMTAGDPSLKRNEELIPAFEREGVDVVELGVPFSDPLADGPVIQAASARALRRGTTLSGILQSVRRIRQKSGLPIVLMSYLNPILRFGVEAFALHASRAGVDGVVIPDLPVDEGAPYRRILRRRGIHVIYLLAPTSTPARRKWILRESGGFVYYVSVTGITGMRRALPTGLSSDLDRLRRQSGIPVCVGFGISAPAQARQVAGHSDGVILGSFIVESLHRHPGLSAAAFSRRFVRPLALALGKKG